MASTLVIDDGLDAAALVVLAKAADQLSPLAAGLVDMCQKRSPAPELNAIGDVFSNRTAGNSIDYRMKSQLAAST